MFKKILYTVSLSFLSVQCMQLDYAKFDCQQVSNFFKGFARDLNKAFQDDLLIKNDPKGPKQFVLISNVLTILNNVSEAAEVLNLIRENKEFLTIKKKYEKGVKCFYFEGDTEDKNHIEMILNNIKAINNNFAVNNSENSIENLSSNIYNILLIANQNLKSLSAFKLEAEYLSLDVMQERSEAVVICFVTAITKVMKLIDSYYEKQNSSYKDVFPKAVQKNIQFLEKRGIQIFNV